MGAYRHLRSAATVVIMSLGAVLIAPGSASAQPRFEPVLVNMQTAPFSEPLAVDIDGDGHVDLVSTGLVFGSEESNEGVSVARGDGEGGFSSPVLSLLPDSFLYGVAAGDFDGDGDIDLVGRDFDRASLVVLSNDGQAQFSPRLQGYVAQSVQVSIGVGDLDADGDLDLVVGGGASGGLVTTWLGDGRGRFARQSASLRIDGSLGDVAVGDVNGDGDLDAVVGTWKFNGTSYPDQIRVLLGDGSGGVREGARLFVGRHPESVTLADLDENGIVDIVTANAGYQDRVSPLNSSVSVLLGLGEGAFEAAVNYPAGSRPSDVETADFDGDGLLDVVVFDRFGVNAVLILDGDGDGDGSLGAPTRFAVGRQDTEDSVAVADFDGDGRPDFAAPAEQQTLLVGLNRSR